MKNEKLIQTLEKIGDELSTAYEKIPMVNFGGCGVFAEILGEKLEAKGYKPKYVVLSISTHKTIRLARAIMRNEKKPTLSELFYYVGFNHTHVVVKVGKYHIDATGFRGDYEDYKIGMTIDANTLKSWNNEVDMWNDDFNRTIGIPKINKVLDKILQKY